MLDGAAKSCGADNRAALTTFADVGEKKELRREFEGPVEVECGREDSRSPGGACRVVLRGVKLDLVDVLAELVVGAKLRELPVALENLHRRLDDGGDGLTEGTELFDQRGRR